MTATTAAAMTTVVTELSYISRACSAESPASTISAVKTFDPTTATPMPRMTRPTAALAMAARAIRAAEAAADHGRARPIADAADRLDVARLVRVVVELVAQASDVDVDGAIQDLGCLVAVDRVEELVARQDAAVRAEDRRQQTELDAGQVDDGAVVAADLVSGGVDGRGRRGGGRDRWPGPDGAWARSGRAPGRSRDGVRRRIDLTRRTSSAGENGFGR